MLGLVFLGKLRICHHFAATWRGRAVGFSREVLSDALRDGDYYA
jgi:hypothetical protein